MTYSVHYVANIKVEKVELEEFSQPGSRGLTADSRSQKRKVGEVTQITVKAPTMEALKTRIAAHVALVEDDVPLDPKQGVTR